MNAVATLHIVTAVSCSVLCVLFTRYVMKTKSKEFVFCQLCLYCNNVSWQ